MIQTVKYIFFQKNHLAEIKNNLPVDSFNKKKTNKFVVSKKTCNFATNSGEKSRKKQMHKLIISHLTEDA